MTLMFTPSLRAAKFAPSDRHERDKGALTLDFLSVLHDLHDSRTRSVYLGNGDFPPCVSTGEHGYF